MRKNLIRGVGIGILASLLSGFVTQAESNPPDYYQVGGTVSYNWGYGGPNGLRDNFTALFDQSRIFSAGDYFIQSFADDGVKVEADGKFLIDRTTNYTGAIDRALWTGVSSGYHTVKTHYNEGGYQAGVFSHIMPLDSWVAYYYPNKDLAGFPTASKTILPVGATKKLYEDHGAGSPAPGIPSDNFSARYSTAKRIPAGEYILRARADDGIRVYIDGQLVVDNWKNGAFADDAVKINIADREIAQSSEKDIHWVEVQYYDYKYSGKLEVFLEPFETAIQNNWVAEYYPNSTFQGKPTLMGGTNAINKIPSINFNWGNGKPHSSIPADRFSARFTKKEYFAAGTYALNLNGDDGARVYIDDKLVIDAWPNSTFKTKSKAQYIPAGYHTIRIDYYENTYRAFLTFNHQKLTQIASQKVRDIQYNWGNGSVAAGQPIDNFYGLFDQSGSYSSGDYFVQAFADDGVKVEADGKMLIDRWTNHTGEPDRALWLGVTDGSHSVKSHYFEGGYGAALFSHVVQLDSWLAYYYPNKDLSGMPKSAKVIPKSATHNGLFEDHGTGSPAAGIPNDNFSALYTTAKRIPAGEYILRARADDGVRVRVDGKLVVNDWSNGAFSEDAVKINIEDRPNVSVSEKDIHWIEVEYFDYKYAGKVEFLLEPYINSNENTWVGEFYPNQNFSGNAVLVGGVNSLNKVSEIDYSWGNGAPFAGMPADHFTARFTKQANLEAGTYVFSANADDSVRVYLDNQLIIDAWPNSGFNTTKKAIYIPGGKHTVKVEYFENTYRAFLKADYQKISSEKVFYDYTKEVQYDWGSGSPSGFSTDGYKAVFDQSQYFNSGDHFVQTLADGHINVQVNNQTKINRITDNGLELNQSALKLAVGEQNINTTYYDQIGDGLIYSHIAPFDSWIAYYYSNKEVSGKPAGAKILSATGVNKSLVDIVGTGSPLPGKVPVDNFSGVYRTAKRLSAGEYVIRAKADDGVRVYVDGQLVLDRWTSGQTQEDAVKITINDRNVTNPDEKNIHWIEVRQFEDIGSSNIEFALLPISDVLDTDQWVGFFYPNKELTGNSAVIGGKGALQQIQSLNFNWGAGQPHKLIPADNFSAKFRKKAHFNAGLYEIKTLSDDGIRVYVDGKLTINSWINGGNNNQTAIINLTAGVHEIIVEYYDSTYSAELKVDILSLDATRRFVSSVKLPAYRSYEELADYTKHLQYYNPSYTRLFELIYGDVVYVIEEKLYGTKVRTQDGKIGWVHKDYLEVSLTEDLWLIKEGRNLRSDSLATSTNLGYVSAGSKVKLLDHKTTSDPNYSEWYYVQTEAGQRGWIWGAISVGSNQGYNLIKYEFSQVGKIVNTISPFTPLNTKSNITADQINRFINYKTNGVKTVMTGMGYAYLKAQEQSGLNAVYLLAHSGLETGWGKSYIVNTKYNFYGIGAIDSQPAEGAYDYSTPEGGIIAGASWISKNYVIRAGDTDANIPFYQPTVDNMRNDNSWHQYASDEAWAVKIAHFAQEFYNFTY